MMPQITLKRLYLIFILFPYIIFFSCGNGIDKQTATSSGFAFIEKAIKQKFGEHAFYTDLSITYNSAAGNIVSVTVSEVPESLKMEQWNASQGIWKQYQDISIEVPHGSEASDFMFQLNDVINLSKLGSLVETSITELNVQKNIGNPTLHRASIKFPKDGDLSKTEYLVILKPETGGRAFTFCYNINSELIK